jgi:hypothetical protein
MATLKMRVTGMESGEIGAEIRGLIKSLHTEQIFFNPQPF